MSIGKVTILDLFIVGPGQIGITPVVALLFKFIDTIPRFISYDVLA